MVFKKTPPLYKQGGIFFATLDTVNSKFVLYTKPVVQNKRLMMSRGRMIATSLWRDTKDNLFYEIKEQYKGKLLDKKGVAVYINFYFGDKRKRDVDAYVKVLFDAMSNIVYTDDSLITFFTARKNYDKENPRTEVEVCVDNDYYE